MEKGKSVWVYYNNTCDGTVPKEIIRLARRYKGKWEGSGASKTEADISFYFSRRHINNARNFARAVKKLSVVNRVSIFTQED